MLSTMAIKSTSLAICLFFSLATIATAYYSPSSPPVHQSPEYKPTLSPPVYIPKPTLPPPVYTPPVYKPTLPPPVYTPPVYKPTLPPPVYKKSPSYPHPSYVPKPTYTPPTKPYVPKPTYSPPTKPYVPKPTYTPPTKPYVPKPTYTPPTKPYVPKPTYSPPTKPYVPKPTYTPPTKPYVPKPTYTPPTKSYVPKPTYTPPTKPYVSKPTYTPPTKPYVPEILKVVDGIILCKNGYETYPIQGAKAMIVCSEPGSYGKKDVVIYSDPTGSKGYFHVALTDIIKNLLHCRVKLYTSPVETCKNPTNVNKGLTGVPLSMYGHRYHSDKNLKIFSVGPFYFTGPKAAPTTPKY
ncbi:proline-rich protein 3 [Brassica rapa]|uniref:proline-rich protein 3 n=1 Tax=Brassica campestris TaxID=3711 RepID=UPI00142E3C62|nr:proline-rich protein 3 [Brassica rapa]